MISTARSYTLLCSHCNTNWVLSTAPGFSFCPNTTNFGTRHCSLWLEVIEDTFCFQVGPSFFGVISWLMPVCASQLWSLPLRSVSRSLPSTEGSAPCCSAGSTSGTSDTTAWTRRMLLSGKFYSQGHRLILGCPHVCASILSQPSITTG